MLINYNDCIKEYGSDYMLKKAIENGELFQIDRGIYSTEKTYSELDLIAIRYPKAIFSGESAYYYHGLTDFIPEYYFLSTKRNDTRIKDSKVKQSFVNEELFEIGKTIINYQNTSLCVYNKERLLIDLIRFKNKMPFDFYKDVIGNYRRIVDELSFFELEDIANILRCGEYIMKTIQLEVM